MLTVQSFIAASMTGGLRSLWPWLLLGLTFLASCALLEPNPVPHDPTVVGVIAEKTRLTDDGSTWEFALVDGQTVTIHFDVAEPLEHTGGQDPGNLVLYGTIDEQPWYATLRPLNTTPGCYLLVDHARDEGDRIQFDGGLRLPKAADFTPGPNDNGRIAGGGATGGEDFCINERGEVRSYGPGIYHLEGAS